MWSHAMNPIAYVSTEHQVNHLFGPNVVCPCTNRIQECGADKGQIMHMQPNALNLNHCFFNLG